VAAARWLADVFGFESPNPLPDDQRGSPWIEVRVGNSSLMVFGLDNGPPDGAPATHVPWVYVDDLDAHFNRARDAGATIVEGIRRHGYRSYVAEDLEGHRWTIAQARPTMD